MELEKQIAELAENVKGLKVQADKAEGAEKKALEAEITAKNAEIAAKEAKLAADGASKSAGETADAIKGIKEWQVKKDERDAANQEVINKGIASANRGSMKESSGLPFDEVLQNTLTENKDAFDDFLKKGTGKLKLDLKAVGDMTFGTNFSTAVSSVTTVRNQAIMLPNRKVHVRSLLPIDRMDGSSFTYLKEGAGEGSIAPVAEGTLKPQIDIDLTEATVQAQYIAGWLRISRKMLDDVKGMTSYLNARLPEKLLNVEDAQLLNGSGSGANIKGITASGNNTAAASAATIDIEQIIDAIAQLEDNDRDANGILVRPSDYYTFFKNKASGSGEYDLPSNVTFVNGTLFVAGVPMYASTAMTVDKFIVGDWRMGAQLLVRENPSIVFAFEDGINIRENMVTVRIEERIAFPVYGSDFFIYGDFGNVA